MTKKILLKWLDEQKAKALAQVNQQEKAAREALLAEKLERTKFDELVAYLLPRMNEIHERLDTWHAENAELAGPVCYCYGSLYYAIHNLLVSNRSAAEMLRDSEIKEAQVDRDLKKQFNTLRREVEKTYSNVAMNVNALANAKLGLEYLSGLGFDLRNLVANQERPVETALAVPINTSFLLLTPKEV